MKPMFRRATPLLLFAALLALQAVPAGATNNHPPPYEPPAVAGNPALDEGCGLDFLLVIDRSGSVQDDADDIKGAAKSFLGAMADTGSKAGIVSFADGARVDAEPAELTSGSLPGFKHAVDGLDFGGYTNWDAGLAKGLDQFADYGGRPDLVIVITDGNPNRWLDADKPNGVDNDDFAKDQAVEQANAMKDAGAHLFVVGVNGNEGLNESALQAISGGVEWTDGSFGDADWTLVENFGALNAKLAAIASDLCFNIKVEKSADPMSASPGDKVTYSYVVTNTGELPLSDVVVDDDVLGRIGEIAVLQPGQSKSFEVTVTIEASSPTTNKVTAVGWDPRQRKFQDSDEVTISIVIPETTTTTAPPVTTTTAPPVTTTTAAPVTPTTIPAEVLGETVVQAELPRTGANPRGLLLAAAALILAGLSLVASTRRARTA